MMSRDKHSLPSYIKTSQKGRLLIDLHVVKSKNKSLCLLSKVSVAVQMTKGPGFFTFPPALVRLRSTKTDRPTGRRVAVGHYSRPPALAIHSSH
jgi:hypothetical protein